MLIELSVSEFARELSSDSPAPGGGSVAALSGTLASGLIGMVCRLTAGKKGFEAQTPEINSVKNEADDLLKKLEDLIDKDTDAFNQVMAAFRMPKTSDQEKSDRSAAIQAAFQLAVNIPLETVRSCNRLLVLAEKIVETANPNCLSDLGVAGQSAYSGLQGAVMNVRINLPSIKDTDFKDTVQEEVDQILSDAKRRHVDLDHVINQKL